MNDQVTGVECSNFRYGRLYHYSNDLFIGNSIRLYGEYCEAEIQVMRRYLKKDAVVYDIGANIGSHSVAFSKLFPEGQIIAFEPNPKHYQILCMNIALNDCHNVRAFNAAATARSHMTVVEDFDAGRQGNFGIIHIGTGSIPCQGLALDHVDTPDPDAIKIDVEGFETDVLMGAASRVERARPVIFYEAQEAQTLEGCYNFLAERDYLMYWVVVTNYTADNFNRNPIDVFNNTGVSNILALPRERVDQPQDLAPVIGPDDTYSRMYERVIQGKLPYRMRF